MRLSPDTLALHNKRYRARLDPIEIWVKQLEEFPERDISRSQVSSTLRVFLNHEPEQEAS